MSTTEHSIQDEVSVDYNGYILLAGRTLTQAEAIELALALTKATQRSIDRNQVNTPGYYDSTEIIRRSESKLGKAISALKAVWR